eukprot:TRINITY_DN49520_c0_g1_i1.p1 TRINITY_DN49520_c0_g1~~TRINITY_DN49520_c0_g1_i1.p1  ORF type:complete len:203 (+),score=25.61 TRINITY_DN49520_c0_g1_i1:29-637(+)
MATVARTFSVDFSNNGASSSSAMPVQPDYFFRCSYCIKLIAEDSPVYMRHDYCYCSPLCRDKGLSRLYTSLRESQLEAGRMSSGSLATAGNFRSDSSIASRTTSRTHDDIVEGGRLGPLARLGQRVIDAMLQRVASQTWGAQVLRTYSTSMLWGRDLTQNTSVAPLFNYLPQVDHYIPKVDSYQSDKSPSSENFDAQLHTSS